MIISLITTKSLVYNERVMYTCRLRGIHVHFYTVSHPSNTRNCSERHSDDVDASHQCVLFIQYLRSYFTGIQLIVPYII